MTKQEALLAGSLALLAAAGTGCGGADVKVAFDNTAPVASGQALTLADAHTPSVFGLKLVAIYLAEDIDADTSNVGEVGRIWTNPVCDPDLYQCGIGKEAGANQVKDYFDLALPSEVVNQRLNAQGATIKAGSYRYLRMDMVGIEKDHAAHIANLRYGADAAHAQEIRFRSNNYLIPLDPPLDINDGDAVTVTLGYDLRGTFFDGPGLNLSHPPDGTAQADWYCAGDLAEGGPCLHFTGFVPAVKR
jgi:hypothetical protein